MASLSEMYEVASALQNRREAANPVRSAGRAFFGGLGDTLQENLNPSLDQMLQMAQVQQAQQQVQQNAIQMEGIKQFYKERGIDVDNIMGTSQNPRQAWFQKFTKKDPAEQTRTNAGAVNRFLKKDGVMTGATIIPSKTELKISSDGSVKESQNQDYDVWRDLQNAAVSAGLPITGEESIPQLQQMIAKKNQEPTIQEKKFTEEQSEKEQKRQEARKEAKQASTDMLNTVRNLKKRSSKFGLNNLIPTIPGTEKAIFDADFARFQSQKILEVMARLKELSPTGSTGFGALSEKEMSVLANAATSLQKNLPDEEARKRLDEIESLLEKAISGLDEPDGSGKGSVDVQVGSAVGTSTPQWNKTSTGMKYRVIE